MSRQLYSETGQTTIFLTCEGNSNDVPYKFHSVFNLWRKLILTHLNSLDTLFGRINTHICSILLTTTRHSSGGSKMCSDMCNLNFQDFDECLRGCSLSTTRIDKKWLNPRVLFTWSSGKILSILLTTTRQISRGRCARTSLRWISRTLWTASGPAPYNIIVISDWRPSTLCMDQRKKQS